MKQALRGILFGVLIGIVALPQFPIGAQTQGGPLPPNATPSTQSATRADAAVNCQTTTSSATAINFVAQPGLTFYLTEVDIANVQTTTGVTAGAAETISTSNLPGSIAWTLATGPTTTPGTNTQTFSVIYPTGLKSTIGSTLTSITNATTISNQVVRLTACGFYA